MNSQTAPGWFDLGPSGGFLATAATIGAVVAGAAVIEAALVPGLAIGAAAVIAPRLLNFGKAKAAAKPAAKPGPKAARFAKVIEHEPGAAASDATLGEALMRMKPGRALAKTITFRVLVTTLDFGANFIILGDLTTAAGLSGFSLVAGPVFYFMHESAWNYLGGEAAAAARTGEDKGVRVFLLGYALTPALAKTITYRAMATVAEFTTSYIVVQDLATAALLSSTGFFLGPFVYYGHERAWEIFGSEAKPVAPAAGQAVSLLAAPRPVA